MNIEIKHIAGLIMLVTGIFFLYQAAYLRGIKERILNKGKVVEGRVVGIEKTDQNEL
ncbi:MAG: hypothetical protein GY749_02695 [Desulfobacteraceae bacterium]|nr:hypothetical protein [Desulfobacteraceae bacterium]